MMTRVLWCLLALVALATPARAQTSADPCGSGPRPIVVAHLRIEREVAVYLAKHAQRACKSIQAFATTNAALMDPVSSTRLEAVIRKLQADILEPVYASFPTLRDKDLTAEPTPRFDHTFRSARMAEERVLNEAQFGEESARYISRVSEEAVKLLSGSFPRKRRNETNRALIDFYAEASVEISFIAAPVNQRLPNLRFEKARQRRVEPLTEATAERFRKIVPPQGSVQISPAALKTIRAFYDEVRKQPGEEEAVIDISWVERSAARGPEDKEWTRFPPKVGIGAWSRKQVPTDVNRYYDGLPIVFGGDTRERFAGKLIDVEGKDFVIRASAK